MGPYSFKADLLDPSQDNTWELDPGILRLNGKLYLLGTFYNGSQPMFIRPLSDPWTASGTRRILSTPTYGWETVAARSTRAPRSCSGTGSQGRQPTGSGDHDAERAGAGGRPQQEWAEDSADDEEVEETEQGRDAAEERTGAPTWPGGRQDRGVALTGVILSQ
ncbi:hypothetical protein GCM10011428_71320 [Streptomyces violaceus]|uniref:hypothetical protein n=1 Tax=Streptomyces violaceus TaxID=1936 RepID=UPI0031ECB099